MMLLNNMVTFLLLCIFYNYYDYFVDIEDIRADEESVTLYDF